MSWEGANRRRFPRADYACLVRLRKKGSSELFKTRTENIGCGGVCVVLPKEIEMFSPVEIELDLENTIGKVGCDGMVVWVIRRSEATKDSSTSFDTGIEFSNLHEEAKNRIEKVVKQCLQKSKS
jgi:Tfp pilus assembly protein PilZ